MNKAWLWVAAACVLGWIFAAISPKRERVPPGSPEYEAWLAEL